MRFGDLVRRKDLVALLEGTPDFPDPRPELEQYQTPAAIAADLIWEASQEGHMDGTVLDLGCGTGILSKAAAAMGGDVTGVDADAEAIALAKALVPEARFLVADVADWHPDPFDAVIMNPPFGAQKRHADRVFFERAIEACPKGPIWFLQQPVGERFFQAFFREKGLSVERALSWDYPIEARFAFHDDKVRSFRVAGYVALA